jgi:hypothetical protein
LYRSRRDVGILGQNKDMDLKVDDLVASIRKSVDSDMDSLAGEARGTLMRGALREMRVSMDGDAAALHLARSVPAREDIPSLRERIRRNVEQTELLAAAQPAPPPPSSYARPQPPRPTRSDFSDIMALPPPGQPQSAPDLRGGYAHRDVQDMAYQGDGWQEAPQEPVYGHPYGATHAAARGQPLLSAQAEHATEQAFRQLSDTLLARATGDRGIEDMTRELLRSMIKQWLDANLPALVEDLVREEIERVARRGR